MSGNRVVVHKRNQIPSHIDQLGTTIPMAELFANMPDTQPLPKPKIERTVRLVPVPMSQANSVGDMPQASMAARTVQAVLFDLDTTLIETAQWRNAALAKTLSLFGFGDHPGLGSFASRSPIPTKDVLENLSQEYGLPRSLHGLMARLEQACLRREIDTCCHPDSEKEYLLMRLQRDGYRLAACSDSDRRTIETILERTKLRPYFEVVISSTEVVSAKPSPDLYLSACDQLGLRPRQVAVLESTPRGLESARIAGTHALESPGIREVEWMHLRQLLLRIESNPTGGAPC